MSPQLAAIVEDLESAARRLSRLGGTATHDGWRRRPAPSSWSAAECVHHLNLMSEALLPRLWAALNAVGHERLAGRAHYRRDLMGWLIGQAMAPSGGLKTATVEAFEPSADIATANLLDAFNRLQKDLIACVSAADGLALEQAKITSPYDSRVRYNLYSALTLIAQHQHRHLLQAERAVRAVASPISAAAV